MRDRSDELRSSLLFEQHPSTLTDPRAIPILPLMPGWLFLVMMGAIVVGVGVGVVIAMRRQAAKAWEGVVTDISRQKGHTSGGRPYTNVTVTCRRTDGDGEGQVETFVYEKGSLGALGASSLAGLEVGDELVKIAGAAFPRRA